VFTDRADAGRRLGLALAADPPPSPVVLGLTRGGVPVAAEVARSLDCPLDALVVRKLGSPRQPELALGAIAEDGVRLVDDDLVRRVGVSADALADIEARERAALDRRLRTLREGRPAVPLTGRSAVIIDDGVATGASARSACRVARARGASSVVLAVPVGPPGVERLFDDDADRVLVLEQPAWFAAVGQAYDDFSQTSDAEVIAVLRLLGQR
jgi:predicted phosphoribosyltransferase